MGKTHDPSSRAPLTRLALILGESAPKIISMLRTDLQRRIAGAVLALTAAYLVAAYLVAPGLWRHYERQAEVANLGARTSTAQGIPGDVVNVGLSGSQADLLCAMSAPGWSPADPVTLVSSLKIVGDVAFRRPYANAPVSPLFLNGRRQDFAFEKASGTSPRTRHHVRFWKASEAGDDGRPVWLGAAVFDDGVGVSHYTGQITHHTAPDIDAERDFLMKDLAETKAVARFYWTSGVGPTLFGRNGNGDRLFTDGEIAFADLASGCAPHQAAPTTEPPPPHIAARSAVFRWFAQLVEAVRSERARSAAPTTQP